MMELKHEGRILRVTDGDTLIVLLNLGYEVYREIKIRLEGIDTPEIKGEERAEGLKVKEFVKKYIGNKELVVISNGTRDKYGRWVCRVEINKQDLTDLLLKENMGEKYPKWFWRFF